jgi:hypothetical protein
MAPSPLHRLHGLVVGSEAFFVGLEAPFSAFTAPNAVETMLMGVVPFYPNVTVKARMKRCRPGRPSCHRQDAPVWPVLDAWLHGIFRQT